MNDERNLGEKTDDSGQQPRYEHYQFHEEQGTVLKPSGPSEHRRNQKSFQKKAVMQQRSLPVEMFMI